MRVNDKSRRLRWRPWLWFAGLYLASLLVYAALMFLPHLILAY